MYPAQFVSFTPPGPRINVRNRNSDNAEMEETATTIVHLPRVISIDLDRHGAVVQSADHTLGIARFYTHHVVQLRMNGLAARCFGAVFLRMARVR
jgi:hypothetical protein